MVKYGTNAHLCAIHTVKHLILIAFVAVYMVKYVGFYSFLSIYTVKYVGFYSFVFIYTVFDVFLPRAGGMVRWLLLVVLAHICAVKYGTNAHLCAIHTVKHLILIAFVAVYMVKYVGFYSFLSIYTVKYVGFYSFVFIYTVFDVTFFLQIIGVLPYESLREASISAAWRST